jgi:hypothetical protein
MAPPNDAEAVLLAVGAKDCDGECGQTIGCGGQKPV